MEVRPEDSQAADSSLTASHRWVLFATILASSMVFIDGTALNVALPAIQADLGSSAAGLLWVMNAYLLMLASLILVGGSLGDRLGRKRVFMAGITLFISASLACGLAPGTGVLIAFRVVQGIGGALMIPGSLAIIAADFAPGVRGKAYGVWASTTAIVTVSGPVIGGVLADAGLWRGVFLINLPLGLAALLAFRYRVAESRDPEAPPRTDFRGSALAAAGLGSLTYGFIRAPADGFSNSTVAGAIALGLLLLVLFVINEKFTGYAMMPLRLFRSMTFSGANLLTLFLYGALSVSTFFLSLNLIQIQGYRPTFAGLAFLPFVFVLATLSPLSGSLADRYSPRLPLVAGPALTGLALLHMGLLGQTQGAADYWGTFFPGVLLLGLGMSLTVAPLTTAVMGSVATHHAGVASGVNNSVSRIAGVLAIAVLGAVFLIAFTGSLSDRTAALPLTGEERAAVLAEAPKLGNAAVPAGLEPDLAAGVEASLRLAFVDSFRLLMIICAILAWLSSLTAALMVGPRAAAEKK